MIEISLIIIPSLSSLSEGRWEINLKTYHREWRPLAIITGGKICFAKKSVLFQDNARWYDQYTGQVGSDGNKAGDKKNKSIGKKIL